jgi:hypothetical protein
MNQTNLSNQEFIALVMRAVRATLQMLRLGDREWVLRLLDLKSLWVLKVMSLTIQRTTVTVVFKVLVVQQTLILTVLSPLFLQIGVVFTGRKRT